MMPVDTDQLRAYVEYFRDLGVYDFYRRGEPSEEVPGVLSVAAAEAEPAAPEAKTYQGQAGPTPAVVVGVDAAPKARSRAEQAPAGGDVEPAIGRPTSFNDLAALPEVRVAAPDKAAALLAVREDIGDCTRCPLAYAGRHMIVFGNGDANARVMFVGEGPGADEDASGLPFVGKAGQLLNNMIGAMGLAREQVYVANVVKCRPPQNRVPEPVEANTCSQFLLRQMDIVQPEVVVALGSTAAIYVLGVKQSLSSLRGRWHSVRGAKLAVTYHPAFLLRDPRQKAEAWKDLQMVMKELGLKAPSKS